jgi:hypothetical protein
VALRDRNNKALADILDAIEEVNHRTTWAQAQRILIENDSFAKDSTLQGSGNGMRWIFTGSKMNLS